MAERVGFEPTIRLYTGYAISSRAPSTTRTPLRAGANIMTRSQTDCLNRSRSVPQRFSGLQHVFDPRLGQRFSAQIQEADPLPLDSVFKA